MADDAEYLNFFAQVEGVLPTTFFSTEDGKPFDVASIDIAGQLAAVGRLLGRSHDVRLLTTRARLLILNRDLKGFAVSVAALAEWLERDWDAVHPRPEGGHLELRRAAVNALNLPTVIFPLQYTPLLEGRRVGTVSYRSWMVASGEVKARDGEAAISSSVITETIAEADATAVLLRLRGDLKLLHEGVQRIERAFAAHGSSVTLDQLEVLTGRMRTLIDPSVVAPSQGSEGGADGDGLFPQQQAASLGAAGPAPNSIALASAALAAIAEYYNRAEPSSPTLPLVRQAHQLIGKSFLDVMTILVPTQVDKASFAIGKDQVFELPVSKLAGLSSSAAAPLSISLGDSTAAIVSGQAAPATPYTITARSQALALLDLVQRYFRHTEPSSPVPMLCERARALAELDFMSVLNDVLPKSTLKAR